jgi:trimeric autotransporter adhesin
VSALVMLPNGDLVAGGTFSTAGGTAAALIARWDGSAWAPLGVGFTGTGFFAAPGVRALLVRSTGELIAGGRFENSGTTVVDHIASWNGTAWASVGGGVTSSHLNGEAQVLALAELPSGALVAAGNFGQAGLQLTGRIAQWNGSVWSNMSSGWPVGAFPVRCLAFRRDGTLVAGGTYGAGFGGSGPLVASWDGASWNPISTLHSVGGLGDGYVAALAPLPNGDVLVGGHGVSTTVNGPNNELLRLQGGAFVPVGGTVQGDVAVLRWLGDGVAVGGTFTAVGGTTATGFAELRSSCAATVGQLVPGCSGSAGPNTLTPTVLPWLGATFRATATGLPTNSLGLAVTSLSPQTLPLSLVLPFAGAGCQGLLAADLTELLLPQGGSASTTLVLPPSAAFAGFVLYQYVAVLEFSGAGQAIGLAATDALALTLGAF